MVRKKQKTMADLLGEGSLSIQQLKRGEVVEGTVVEVKKNAVLVNVGAKAEGIIRQTELKNSDFTIGDKVFVYVLTPEDKRGRLLLSLSRAERVKNWLELEKAYRDEEVLGVDVVGHNKGGLVVDVKGLSGFVPFSHTDCAPVPSMDTYEMQSFLDKLRGKKLEVRIIELEKDQRRIILSETEASINKLLKERQKALSKLKKDENVSGQITAVMPYGLTVDLGGIEGLIPKEEIVWDEGLIDETLTQFEVGKNVKAKIIEIDERSGKAKLSLKRITADPWQELTSKHTSGDQVKVTVGKITSYGVFANLDGVEGMIPLSSIPQDKELKIGQEIPVVIEIIDPKKHRLDFTFSLNSKPIEKRIQ